jgi:amino acid adenylation domain-containing protein
MTAEVTDFRKAWCQTVRMFPDRAAIEVAATGAKTSYADLHRAAAALASRMREAEVTAGQLVGLRINDRARFCTGLLAAWLSDAVPVPLSATAPEGYIRALASRLGIAIVLREGGGAEGVTVTSQSGRSTAAIPKTAAGLAYVMHTSGSTGKPKAVALSHAALAAYCRTFTAATGLTGEDRFLQLAPATFDVVFEELLPIWGVGGTAVLAPQTPGDPGWLLATIEECNITVAELTTVYWRLLVRHLRASPRAIPDCLRLLLAGGEQASASLIGQSLRLGLPLAHVYGVTEAGITSTIQFFDPGGPVTVASVGPSLANSTIHVVDHAGAAVSVGHIGEVWIGGDSLADGYLGDPGETARRFVDVAEGGSLPSGRYYRTGDAGRLSARCELEILGRLDDQVKINGKRVDLAEVEATIEMFPLVASAAVVAISGPSGSKRLKGYVVPADDVASASLEAPLRGFLRGRLPSHLVPEQVTVLTAFPVTEHGKVDKRALAGMQSDEQGFLDLAALTSSQRAAAQAWTEAIGHAPSSLDQRFMDAGGDSFAIMALVVNLQERGLAIAPADILSCPTLRALAAFIDQGAGGNPLAAAVPSGGEEQSRQALRRTHLARRRAGYRSAP